MKLILKLFAIPIVIVLTPLTWVCFGMLYITSWVFGLASLILSVLGVFGLFTVTVRVGVEILIIAFLVSPVGLPLAAARVIGWIDALNQSLKDFICG